MHQEIDQITRDFQQEFSGISSEQLNWKPSPDKWSIGQHIDHLMVINRSYYPIIEEIRQGTYKVPAIGKIGFLVRFFGNFIYKSSGPDRSKPIRTFPVWEPSTSNIDADVLTRFIKHQEELKEFIDGCADLIEAGQVIHSPANRKIVYTLEKAFDIIVVHEKRHFLHARDVLKLQSAN